MNVLSSDKAFARQRFFRVNIAFGILVFIIALVSILGGEYTDLVDRMAAVSHYNNVALGGLLYAAFAWIVCKLI